MKPEFHKDGSISFTYKGEWRKNQKHLPMVVLSGFSLDDKRKFWKHFQKHGWAVSAHLDAYFKV